MRASRDPSPRCTAGWDRTTAQKSLHSLGPLSDGRNSLESLPNVVSIRPLYRANCSTVAKNARMTKHYFVLYRSITVCRFLATDPVITRGSRHSLQPHSAAGWWRELVGRGSHVRPLSRCSSSRFFRNVGVDPGTPDRSDDPTQRVLRYWSNLQNGQTRVRIAKSGGIPSAEVIGSRGCHDGSGEWMNNRK